MEQLGPGQAVLERPTPARRALVVMNPAVDRCSPAEVRATISRTLEARGWSCRVVEVKSIDQLDQAAEQAGREEYDLVVVAGGDGTISRVARHLVGTEVLLGILPVGRDNSLSRNLSIPPDSDQAASLLIGDHDVGYLDSLQVGDRHFFLQVGTAVVHADEPSAGEARAKGGGPPGLGEKVRQGVGFRTRRFTLMIDGRPQRVGAWQVMVVNTGDFGSEILRWGPPVRPTDGVAELIVLRVRGVGSLFKIGLPFLRRGKDPGISVRYHRVRDKALIVPDDPMPVQGDSEAIGSTPLEVRVVPRTVRVIVPRTTPALAPGVAVQPPAKRRGRWQRGWFRAALLSGLSPLGALDTFLFIAVSRMPHPRPLNLLMRSIEVGMANGRGWIAGMVGTDLLRGRRPWGDLLKVGLPLWLTTFSIEFPIKVVFARPRPFAALVLTPVVGPKPSSYSFPSGHSASAFAGAWLLGRRYPRWSRAFYAFAALVAFSRVYQGAHYPGDVAIGAGIGAGLAAVYQPILGRLIRWVSGRRR